MKAGDVIVDCDGKRKTVATWNGWLYWFEDDILNRVRRIMIPIPKCVHESLVANREA